MNKYYVVTLVEDSNYDEAVLEFDYKEVENALAKEEQLVSLVQESNNDELSVVIETRFDTHYGKWNDGQPVPVVSKEYRRVTGSAGDEYITSADSCSCPSAFYNGPSCKHQGFLRNGLYRYNPEANETDYQRAITERGTNTRKW